MFAAQLLTSRRELVSSMASIASIASIASLPVALPVRPPPGTTTAFADGVVVSGVVGGPEVHAADSARPSAPQIHGGAVGSDDNRGSPSAAEAVPIAAVVNPVVDSGVGNPFMSTARGAGGNPHDNPFAAAADLNAIGNPFASAAPAQPARRRPSSLYGHSQSNSQTLEYHGGRENRVNHAL